MLIRVTPEFSARDNDQYSHVERLFSCGSVGPLFIFPAGLAFHLFIIKRILARNCHEYFQRRGALHDREKFCETSSYIRSGVSQNVCIALEFLSWEYLKEVHSWEEEWYRANYTRNIFSDARLSFLEHCISVISENDNESMALQSTKYHLILSMHLITQLFLIFIYLFTCIVFDDKYCARPLRVLRWMRYKQTTYVLSWPFIMYFLLEKITSVPHIYFGTCK